MILRLLRLISEARMLATTMDMARQLGIGEGLLMSMLEETTRLGYVSPLQTGCQATPCQGCSQHAACFSGGSSRAWALTEKGRRLLAQTPR